MQGFKEVAMNTLNFYENEGREPQLEGLQDCIDTLESLGYSVDGLSNDSIIDLALSLRDELDDEGAS